MKDTISKGAGTSRTLASVPNFLTLYPTYEAFAQALIDRTLPIDLGPVNPSGCVQVGDDLNKANLLKDETAAMYGLGADAVPDDIFGKRLLRVATGSYRGTDQTPIKGNPKILRFGFKPGITIISSGTSPFYTVDKSYGEVVFPWDGAFFRQDGSYRIKTSSSNSQPTSIYFDRLDDGVSFYFGVDNYEHRNILNSSGAEYKYIAIG